MQNVEPTKQPRRDNSKAKRLDLAQRLERRGRVQYKKRKQALALIDIETGEEEHGYAVAVL